MRSRPLEAGLYCFDTVIFRSPVSLRVYATCAHSRTDLLASEKHLAARRSLERYRPALVATLELLEGGDGQRCICGFDNMNAAIRRCLLQKFDDTSALRGAESLQGRGHHDHRVELRVRGPIGPVGAKGMNSFPQAGCCRRSQDTLENVLLIRERWNLASIRREGERRSFPGRSRPQH